MIKVTIYSQNDQIVGFRSAGHAGYDDSGKDIVCAAVSTLVINTVNSIDQFTEDEYEVDQDENNAVIEFKLTAENPSRESRVLLSSLQLGLNAVAKGNEQFLRLKFEEV